MYSEQCTVPVFVLSVSTRPSVTRGTELSWITASRHLLLGENTLHTEGWGEGITNGNTEKKRYFTSAPFQQSHLWRNNSSNSDDIEKANYFKSDIKSCEQFKTDNESNESDSSDGSDKDGSYSDSCNK